MPHEFHISKKQPNRHAHGRQPLGQVGSSSYTVAMDPSAVEVGDTPSFLGGTESVGEIASSSSSSGYGVLGLRSGASETGDGTARWASVDVDGEGLFLVGN